MILDAWTVFIICVTKFVSDLNASYVFSDAEGDIQAIQDSDIEASELESYDDLDARRSPSYECWVKGGICIDIEDCSNHKFYTQIRGCRGDRQVCCMSYNFRELKDLTGLGFPSSLPWKVQRPDMPFEATAGQRQTYETSKQYYKNVFHIDLNKPQRPTNNKDINKQQPLNLDVDKQHTAIDNLDVNKLQKNSFPDPVTDRRSAKYKRWEDSYEFVDDENKMAADYADFNEFFRRAKCDGDNCFNSDKVDINEKIMDEDGPIYYNYIQGDSPKNKTNEVLILIQKI